jgi:asparagine synthase (glutamine-hydrolysing)
MCGILGIAAGPKAKFIGKADSLLSALESHRHRGPDAHGQYRDDNVWFGHTRLSILDLSAAGNQPMQSPDRRFVITYNGEVYNFRDLAAADGIDDLRSGSDTEVVLRLFARQQTGSLARLNGMFAFAVYDMQARRLWLVRDRLGIKPLYYQLEPNRLTFASEIKGILALSPVRPTCDMSALHEWLYYGNPLGERTLYRGIRQLPPGHYLEIELTSFRHELRPYWSLDAQAESALSNVNDIPCTIARTRHLLEQAVRRQLVSDVPVGVFLSGGVDSSAITAFASRHYNGRLATYSAGFDFARRGGELPKAKRVAAYYGTEHHEIHITGGAVGDLVERMIHHHDMPFADAANIPLFLMASQISGQVKVVLQGDGGDELFGGYRRYSTLSYYRLLHAMAGALRPLCRLVPGYSRRDRVRRYLQAFAAEDLATTTALLLTPEDPLSGCAAIFTPCVRSAMEKHDPFARHRACQQIFRDHDIGNQMSFVDLLTTLPDTFLEKVDRATMAASLEVRVPFLDHDLVDFVVQLPASSKIPYGRKKWLLKSALAGIVPAEVLRGPKVGLEVPIRHWLQGSLRPLFFDHLTRLERRGPGILDLDHVKGMFEQTVAGQRNHTRLLWKVMNFMVWANNSNVDFVECATATAGI